MGNKPIKSIRVGNVKASVWENEIEHDGKKFTKLSVSFEKSYQDKNNEWQTTNNYEKADLVKLQVAVNKAIEACFVKDE